MGAIIDPKTLLAVEDFVQVSSRNMQIKLKSHSNPLNIINTYAPQNARPIAEKQKHYKELESIINENGANCMNVIFGGLHARIHSRLNGEEPWIGEHVFGRGT